MEAIVIGKEDSLFSIVGENEIGAVREKSTTSCFTGPLYSFKNRGLNHLLPTMQPQSDACVVSVVAPAFCSTLTKITEIFCSVSENTNARVLEQKVRTLGYAMTLNQLERAIEIAEKKPSLGVCMTKGSNYAFVEDRYGDIFAILLSRDAHWSADIRQLISDSHYYGPNSRFLLRNFN